MDSSLSLYFIAFGVIQTQLMDFKFVDPVKDKKLVGVNSLFTQNSIPESECVIHCAANKKCGSVNYHKESKTCVLNTKYVGDPKENLVDAVGWTYYEKSEVMKPYFLFK